MFLLLKPEKTTYDLIYTSFLDPVFFLCLSIITSMAILADFSDHFATFGSFVDFLTTAKFMSTALPHSWVIIGGQRRFTCYASCKKISCFYTIIVIYNYYTSLILKLFIRLEPSGVSAQAKESRGISPFPQYPTKLRSFN